MTIRDQINDVLKKYPSLSISSDKGGYILSGEIIMDKSYNDIPLYENYHLKICIPEDFPVHIPAVFDTNDDVPPSFMHFMDDNSFCLGAHCDLRAFLEDQPLLAAFIDEIVMSYLYAVSFFKLYGAMPFGQRSHGIKGMIEAYQERYSTGENYKLLGHFLCIVVGALPYRGHHLCPCGSGKFLRNCHGPKVLHDLRSKYIDDYQRDADFILEELVKMIKRKEQEQIGKDDTSKKLLR